MKSDAAPDHFPACVLRPAQPDDLKHLAVIDSICFPPAIAYHAKEIAALLRSPAVFTLVAEVAGTQPPIAASAMPAAAFTLPIAAFAMMGRPRPKTSFAGELITPLGELITIDVLPAWRRRGLGHHLYRAMEEMFHRQGGRTLHLHVSVENAAAIGFYRELGYRTVSRVENYYPAVGDTQRDAWRMEKELSD